MKGKTIRLSKGKDSYLQITPLSEYCRERGWRVLMEYVHIALPTGKELRQLIRDMKDGKIKVVNSDIQGKEGKYGK